MKLRSESIIIARERAHAVFDLLWSDGYMTRSAAYLELGTFLRRPAGEAHIGRLSHDECEAVRLWAASSLRSRPGACVLHREQIQNLKHRVGQLEEAAKLKPKPSQVLHLAQVQAAAISQVEKTKRMRMSAEDAERRRLLAEALDMLFDLRESSAAADAWISELPDFAKQILSRRR